MSSPFSQSISHSSPPTSHPRKREYPNMTLDLSLLPPLNLPTAPSNTLIITNIENPQFFESETLSKCKHLINKCALIHSWAPLKSFRRIIVSFFDIDAAICARQLLESFGRLDEECIKIYYGQPTAIEPKDAHLSLPDAGKLFLISPPPSPPHGWQSKAEDAPNKLVVAQDLAEALRNLRTNDTPSLDSPVSDVEDFPSRSHSVSCKTIYRPEEHGGSLHLPAIHVEDTTGDECDISPIQKEKPIYAHTCRPPVELMES